MRAVLALLPLAFAACKTTPILSDAGLSAPPASASASAQASASGSTSAPAPAGSECKLDTDCGPASCCGPYMAEGRCVKTTRRNCQGVLCPQIVSDYACACQNGLCATVRVGAAPAPSGSAAPRPAK